MWGTTNIKDDATREAIARINKRLDRIESVPQLSTATTLDELIKVVNKITNSIKRRRNDT